MYSGAVTTNDILIFAGDIANIKIKTRMRGRKMGFVNDYLTDEEQELFRKKAVHYGNPLYRERCGILGYEPYSTVKCTVDREKQIYFLI